MLCCTCLISTCYIRESVDSLCRDGADTPALTNVTAQLGSAAMNLIIIRSLYKGRLRQHVVEGGSGFMELWNLVSRFQNGLFLLGALM